jgi:hypothetical protein
MAKPKMLKLLEILHGWSPVPQNVQIFSHTGRKFTIL